MQITELRLKNFRAFKDVTLKDIPRFCVFVGANGTGKSTLFKVFHFLQDALASDVTTALGKLGGGREFQEVRSRNSTGAIEILLKFKANRDKVKNPSITYELHIDEENGLPFVALERLSYRRGQRHGKPWLFLDFAKGKGRAVTNELAGVTDEKELQRGEEQQLKRPDILAIKALAQFAQFPAIVALGNLIENWHLSDLRVDKARVIQGMGYAKHLSRDGENLPLVVDYLYKQHRATFDKILELMQTRVPGVNKVDAKTTEDGRVLLRFADGAFEEPFLAQHVSDGTIKMLMYLVLLYDPEPYPLLCVEEPENQLYPSLLEELAEEFRSYAERGGQVFVTAHSPSFLNATTVKEVFWLQKEEGYTKVHRAEKDAQIVAYMKEGDKMGWLWSHGHFNGVNP